MIEKEWISRTELQGLGNGYVIYRDKFSITKEISEIIEYLLKCKDNTRIKNINIKKGNLAGF